ncbi:MAG: hypothetical protein N2748_04670 [candidate division WOR-3 bacterium]|nr:hypothetical protein [candidate division WOR-3 bacterium]
MRASKLKPILKPRLKSKLKSSLDIGLAFILRMLVGWNFDIIQNIVANLWL